MADNPPPPAPSKALVFFRRSASTVMLCALVTWVFVSRCAWAYLGVIGLLTLIATTEYFRMLRVAGVKCFPRFGILLAAAYCAALYAGCLRAWVPALGFDATAIVLCLTGALALQLDQPVRGVESLVAMAANLLGFTYIVLLFNFMARLLFLVPEPGTPPWMVSGHGAYLVLWLLAVTKFTDIGAYVTGSLIGRHKMVPHVSPGKTWEGFGGALLFAQLAGCGMYALCPDLAVLRSWGHVLALGFLIALLAVIGDLAESVIKRALQAKDSGRMLPGIGGALDLIDSLCFTAPALYFYLEWLPHHTA